MCPIEIVEMMDRPRLVLLLGDFCKFVLPVLIGFDDDYVVVLIVLSVLAVLGELDVLWKFRCLVE